MQKIENYIKQHPNCLDERVRGEKSTLYIFVGLDYLEEIMPIIRAMNERVLDIAFKNYRLAVAIADEPLN
jgi:hypothetical protein